MMQPATTMLLIALIEKILIMLTTTIIKKQNKRININTFKVTVDIHGRSEMVMVLA